MIKLDNMKNGVLYSKRRFQGPCYDTSSGAAAQRKILPEQFSPEITQICL